MLSMLIPGAGHIYSGRPGAACLDATTLMGYACCFLPGCSCTDLFCQTPLRPAVLRPWLPAGGAPSA